MNPSAEPKELPLSDNERIKGQSNFLRGTIKEDLKNDLSGGFSHDNFQLIRFHGMYEQDDRDLRAERKEEKLEPLRNVMLRCRIPGGIISPAQWLGIDRFAEENTLYGSIRLTNRQTFQFHGVLKKTIKPMHQWLNHLGLDSLATAGDVNRNVICTSNPVESVLHREAYEWAKKISEHLLPQTHAYAEIWLDKEKKYSTPDQEPILGSTYLPRKFKTAVVIPPANDVDVHANDLNFVAIAENQHLIGFNVLAGGGLSMEHGNKATFPNTAKELGFIPLEHTLKCAAAIVTTQRDWGDRSNRKAARLRYTLHRVGLTVFKKEVEKRMKFKFLPLRPYEFTSRGDKIGWLQGTEGLWHLTLFIENGRILDFPGKPLKTGLREIAKIHQGDLRLTANQNIIIAGVPEAEKEHIEQLARRYGLINDNFTPLRRAAMSCVSFPTCPLAMAEAERMLSGFLDAMDTIMTKHQMSGEAIILRVTGCPNGCGRALLAEIGLVGRSPGRYNLYIGGNVGGTRIPRMYRENIPYAEILTTLDNLIGLWARERQGEEGFGDFVIRYGVVKAVRDAAVDFYDQGLSA